MSPLDLVKLTALMALTSGRAETTVDVIDELVAIDHSNLASQTIRKIPCKLTEAYAQANSAACMHGTFVAGILCAKRSSRSPDDRGENSCKRDLMESGARRLSHH
jgi:hypothetical protein